MQTFRDFLIEYTKTPQDVAQQILDQCMPFVNAVGDVEYDTVLYRGTDADIEDFIPRERKEAGGVTGQYSGERGDMIREFFKRKCGMNIDTLIFATGDLSVAKRFGNPYIIFPTGIFKFAYSKGGIPLPNINNEKVLQEANFACGIADDMSEDGLPDPTFQDAIRSHNEVLIEAKGYLPISLSYWKQNAQAILEELSFR